MFCLIRYCLLGKHFVRGHYLTFYSYAELLFPRFSSYFSDLSSLDPPSHPPSSSRDANLERWLLLHAPVLEASMSRLQAALDDAYLHTSCFVSRAHRAAAAFQQVRQDGLKQALRGLRYSRFLTLYGM